MIVGIRFGFPGAGRAWAAVIWRIGEEPFDVELHDGEFIYVSAVIGRGDGCVFGACGISRCNEKGEKAKKTEFKHPWICMRFIFI
jgi:hypothetical protein